MRTQIDRGRWHSSERRIRGAWPERARCEYEDGSRGASPHNGCCAAVRGPFIGHGACSMSDVTYDRPYSIMPAHGWQRR